MTHETDIAWAAGLFEGEGCFSTEGDSSRPRASMSSTDLDVLQRFQRVVGRGSMYPIPPRRKHHKFAWQWMTLGDEFFAVYDMLEPWLGARRRAKGQEVYRKRVEFVSTMTRPRPCAFCGTVFAPPFKRSVSKKRYCSESCSNRMRKSRALNRAVFQPGRIALPEDEESK